MNKIPLHQLAAYLPYETKVTFKFKGKDVIGTMDAVHSDCTITCYDTVNACPDKFKLMLTTFDKALQNKSLKIEEFNKMYEVKMLLASFGIKCLQYDDFQFALKHHIDIFNLIPQGLAVEKE